jgi:hypothetical protein
MKKQKGQYGKKSRTSLKKQKKEENRKSWRPKNMKVVRRDSRLS